MVSALDSAMKRLGASLERLEAGVARHASGKAVADGASARELRVEVERLARALAEAAERNDRLEAARGGAAEGVARAVATIRAVLEAGDGER